MRILLAFDKFKGTLTAREVTALMREALLERFPDAEIDSVPVSDGGGGMTELFVSALGAERREATVTGPAGAPVTAEYAVLRDGTRAFEMASCAGLTLMKELAPLRATTRGVGELLSRLEGGRVLMGLGGSATCDCGIGMAAALGWRFLDARGSELPPYAESLEKIRRIARPASPFELSVTCACDVDAPLTGENGAVRVFGPQKGVDALLMPRLERGFENMAAVMRNEFGFDAGALSGSGAAGGLGAAAAVFLNARLARGAELLLDAACFDERITSADLVFTGEGRLDAQSSMGKAVSAVALRAHRAGVPCVAVCGAIAGETALPLEAVFAATDGERPFADIARTCREDFLNAARRAASFAERLIEGKTQYEA